MKAPAVLHNLPWRIAGMLLIGVLVVVYQPASDSVVHRLVIPVAMAVGAWLLVQNAVAVALGAGLLAALHSAPGAPGDWIAAWAYPVLALLCTVVLAIVLGHRFRRHIATTHEARWQHRRHGSQDDGA